MAVHIVPLATQTLAMLKEHYRLTGNMDFIFPSLRSRNRQLSSNTLNVALRTMGFGKDEICAHGFRATFVTHVAEYGGGRVRSAHNPYGLECAGIIIKKERTKAPYGAFGALTDFELFLTERGLTYRRCFIIVFIESRKIPAEGDKKK